MATLRVKTDECNRIVDAAPATYAGAVDGWIVTLDDSMSEMQIVAFSDHLKDERGVWRYRLEGGWPVERTASEMDADYATFPPTQEERIVALEEENKHLKEALDLLLSGATQEGEADG